MENQTTPQSGGNKKCQIIAIGLIIGLALGFGGGFLIGSGSGGGSSSVVAFVDAMEKRIASTIKGGRGPVVADVDGTEIYKSVFDRKFDLFVDNLPISPARKVKVKSSGKMLGQFLNGLVESVVLLKTLKDDTKFLEDTDFLVYLSIKVVQTVQEYYLLKKIGDKISDKITEQEYSQGYKMLQKDPRASKVLARMKMAQIKKYIKRQILRQRQMRAVKAFSDKLKQGFRIKTFDNVLLGTGKTK